MFDRAEITVKAGDGGDGAISFRHEKFVPFGGPDGGDGGDGGRVIVAADSAINDLRKFRLKRAYHAAKGGNGMGKRKHGKAGEDLELSVPVGTLVSYGDAVEIENLADLEKQGQRVVVAKGGKGGSGNTHFASSTNQAPQIAQKGEVGERNSIVLEMRLIADAGVIGYPNAGKSTLLASASAAKPKIASYPFTTIEPVLGVVEIGRESLVLAEIPGLVTDAHMGRGLGHDFLRHIMRTRILIHMVDGGSVSPTDDMIHVNEELRLFDPDLAHKPQLVAVNKIDIPEVRARIAELKSDFGDTPGGVYFISAATGEGVSGLMEAAGRMLSRLAAPKEGVETPRKVFRPRPRAGGVTVNKEDDVFVVVVPELERIVTRDGSLDAEVRWQLKRQLARAGANKALEKAGVKPGDRIRWGDIEWEW